MSDYQMFEVHVNQIEPLTEQVKRFHAGGNRWQTITCVYRRKSRHCADERW
ncbi:putative oxidoreductase [Escherichia coli]|nr:putative oxidoreductase [Escherichia coli]